MGSARRGLLSKYHALLGQSHRHPHPFLDGGNLLEIGSALGEVKDVNADIPLIFERRARIPSGKIVKIEFVYDKLHRWCFTCHHISHKERSCPHLTEQQRMEKRLEREAAREYDVQQGEDRTRQRDAPLNTAHDRAPTPSQMRRQEGVSSTNLGRTHRPQLENPKEPRVSRQDIREPSQRHRDSVWKQLDSRSVAHGERYYDPKQGLHQSLGEHSQHPEAEKV